MGLPLQGTQYEIGQTIDQWAEASGLDWTASKRHAFADGGDAMGDTIEAHDFRFIVRDDTCDVLGCISDRYKTVQPRECLESFQGYIANDPRFSLDRAGPVNGGKIVWASAKFNGPLEVAGDKHEAYLLTSTSFDGSLATLHRPSLRRLVCTNQFAMDRCAIRTRHSSHYGAKVVQRQLEIVISGFAKYKVLGDAMALKRLDDEQIQTVFKKVLNVPLETSKDISTRKTNQLEDLNQAYLKTVLESNGEHKGTAWGAFNAVTRYVDHVRSTRTEGGSSSNDTRFASAQFGSGAALKQAAITYLDEMSDMQLLIAVEKKTRSDDDVKDILRQAFTSTRFN